MFKTLGLQKGDIVAVEGFPDITYRVSAVTLVNGSEMFQTTRGEDYWHDTRQIYIVEKGGHVRDMKKEIRE